MRNLQSSQRLGSLILGKTGIDNCDPRRPGAALGRETAELFAQRSVLCSVSPDSWALLVRELAALNNDNSLDASTFNCSSDLVLGVGARKLFVWPGEKVDVEGAFKVCGMGDRVDRA